MKESYLYPIYNTNNSVQMVALSQILNIHWVKKKKKKIFIGYQYLEGMKERYLYPSYKTNHTVHGNLFSDNLNIYLATIREEMKKSYLYPSHQFGDLFSDTKYLFGTNTLKV